MLNIVSWIICGLIIGLLARAIVPGRQSIGTLMTVVLGIIGAFVGGLISTAIWGTPIAQDNPDASRMWPGWILSIIGAVIVLWGYVALAARPDAGRLGTGVR